MTSCHSRLERLTILKVLPLPDFPSGSSLEFYNQRLYIAGDDATHLLVLDGDEKQVDTINLFKSTTPRIPKYKKADLESSTIVHVQQQPHLALFGSASTSLRQTMLLMPLNAAYGADTIRRVSTSIFARRLLTEGLPEINIEGAATVYSNVVLANRGNLTNPNNHLIVTNANFWGNQQNARVLLQQVDLGTKSHFTGISGLYYDPTNDVLFFTASTELTGNSYDDGEIGTSYLGWFNGFSGKMNATTLTPDGLINLAETDKRFLKEKIEGVCVTAFRNQQYDLYLVSDNDGAVSSLFKVQLRLKP